MTAPPEVDVVVLSRGPSPLPQAVEAGLAAQRGVRLTARRVFGPPLPGDPNRWATIARARNAGKRLGRAPWLMYLDDDVELAPDTVATLHRALAANPVYGAVAADYLGEAGAATHTPHVAMGATLFRRVAADLITFRWAPGRCECLCCCDDLRRHGFGLRYWPGAVARHLPREAEAPTTGGTVLTAFDRRHADKFRRRFLRTLRESGNAGPVLAVGYGLYPSEQAVLSSLPGVEVVARPRTEELPPVRRLTDFQDVLARLPAGAPAAYWDAGDVVFQGDLAPLWGEVRATPDRLLAVREPTSHPENPAVAAWTLSVRDPAARERAFRLLSSRPFLNSGFAAGTAETLLAYFREAERMRRSADLLGSTDWGDQAALNLYCHSDPSRWREVDEGWNYCVHARRPGEVALGPDGRLRAASGAPIRAAHGNAHSLRRLELAWLNGPGR